MPGDQVKISENHIKKANVIFPKLVEELKCFSKVQEKVVITVCGGSGVGKSEIASLLAFYLQENGIGAYTLSGDNYPRRIPMYNDAERMRVFRLAAIQEMIRAGAFSPERFSMIEKWQIEETDASKKHAEENPWYEAYLHGGEKGLRNYLGTKKEIDFAELEEIVEKFKAGKDKIWLKRMGRTESELWYDEVDFSHIDVLIIEWTHGNSDCYRGVDIPILLNSTPKETLAHRQARNRDGKTDSPFTMLVLAIEQELLVSQAHKAKIILSKDGELLTYEKYCQLMKESEAESDE